MPARGLRRKRVDRRSRGRRPPVRVPRAADPAGADAGSARDPAPQVRGRQLRPPSDLGDGARPRSRAVVTHVREFVADLDARIASGRGLWLMGDVGTGKTTLAMLVSKLGDRGRALGGDLLAAQAPDPDPADLRRRRRRALLRGVLRAADLGRPAPHRRPRGREAAPTGCWSSSTRSSTSATAASARWSSRPNLEPDALEEQIGPRTVSRLVEICGDPLPLFGDDMRYRLAPP